MSESIVVVLPTYNERENLEGMIQRLRSSVPDAELLIVDDGSPDGTGALGRELAASDPPDPRAAADGQGGSRRRLPGRLRLGARAGCRGHRRVRRRRVAPTRGAAPADRRAARSRPRGGLAVGARWSHRQLAAVATAAVARGQPVCAHAAAVARAGCDRWLPGLPCRRVARHRTRAGRQPRLLLSDRNAVARRARRTPSRRGADHLRGARARRLEDDRRDRARGDAAGDGVGAAGVRGPGARSRCCAGAGERAGSQPGGA